MKILFIFQAFRRILLARSKSTVMSFGKEIWNVHKECFDKNKEIKKNTYRTYNKVQASYIVSNILLHHRSVVCNESVMFIVYAVLVEFIWLCLLRLAKTIAQQYIQPTTITTDNIQSFALTFQTPPTPMITVTVSENMLRSIAIRISIILYTEHADWSFLSCILLRIMFCHYWLR